MFFSSFAHPTLSSQSSPQGHLKSSALHNKHIARYRNPAISSSHPVNCCPSSRQPSYRKCMWTEAEDKILKDAVETHGVKNWSLVSTMVPGRNGKQCRERWSGMLDPELAKEAWTPDEDSLLIKLHNEYGNKWAKISSYLPGRSRISLRNRWSYHVRHNFQKVISNSSPNTSPICTIPTINASPATNKAPSIQLQLQQQHFFSQQQLFTKNIAPTACNKETVYYSSTSSEENEYSESEESSSLCCSSPSSGNQRNDKELGNTSDSLFNFIVFEGKSWEELDHLTNCVETDMLFEPTW